VEPPALAYLGKINNDGPSVGSEKIMDDRTSSLGKSWKDEQ